MSSALQAEEAMTLYHATFFTYGAACGAIRSITRQSVDVVVDVDVVVPSKLKNSVHRAKITIEAIIIGCNKDTWATGDNLGK